MTRWKGSLFFKEERGKYANRRSTVHLLLGKNNCRVRERDICKYTPSAYAHRCSVGLLTR
jgi:hypothetical protein